MKTVRIPKNPSLDWLLTSGYDPITAEQLWHIVYPGPCPLAWADTGFKEMYESLANAINEIRSV